MTSSLDSRRSSFQARLDELAGQRASAPNVGELDEALRAWEGLLDARLAEFRGGRAPQNPEKAAEPGAPSGVPRSAPASVPRPFSRTDPTLQGWVEDVEQMMLGELGLGKGPRPPGFQGPVQIVAHEGEMRAALARYCGGEAYAAGVSGHGLGVLHLPGVGTLVNREHYVQGRVRQVDGSDPQLLAHVVGEVAAERWGWGFLLEYTALGQAAGRAGLWPVLRARRVGMSGGDGPEGDLAAALEESWALLAAGWLDWVWQFVMFKAHNPVGAQLFERPRPGRWMELVVRLVDLFPLTFAAGGVTLRLRNVFDLVKFLFLEESELVPRTLNAVIVGTQAFCRAHDAQVAQTITLSFSQLVGRLYFAKLESRIGILAVPYAVLIAAHLPGALNPAQTGDAFRTARAADPRANPDTRLAVLSKIDPRVKYDPKAMSIAAWERFKLDGPGEFFT